MINEIVNNDLKPKDFIEEVKNKKIKSDLWVLVIESTKVMIQEQKF